MTIYKILAQEGSMEYYVVSEINLAMGELKVVCQAPTLKIDQVKAVGDFKEQVAILEGHQHKVIVSKQDWERMYGIKKG